ncbi:hypothetical protein PT974_00975 [Cladobotryum mycophilum]|uniref:Glycosyltransferase family 31 protein n=1 Tax=Cladobotryum mycophilum TaxID=491253 RepID=A0ABR0T2D7_9HYPO
MLFAKGLPSLQLRFILVLAIFASFLIFVKTFYFLKEPLLDVAVTTTAATTTTTTRADGPLPEEQYLARLSHEFKLTNETEWLAWKIQHSKEASAWTTVNNVRTKFGARSKVVVTGLPNPTDILVTNQMKLPVSASSLPSRPDASEFVFGITTTYAKLMERDGAKMKSWTRWLTKDGKKSNGASLIVMLDQALDEQLKEVEEILSANGINAQVSATEEPMSIARRYHELTKLMKSFGGAVVAAKGHVKKWFALVEDDIFIPNLSYLQDRLSTYQSSAQLYIGMPSEREDWEVIDGNLTTTFGGGAVFLTRPALFQLSHLSCLNPPEHHARFHGKRWDILLQECLTKNTPMRMYTLPGFYSPEDNQANLQGDPYESGVQPLTLHHHFDRHGLDVNMAHMVTNACGNSCFMQRYRFKDNWVLVNGVSISQYLDGHENDSQDNENHARPSMPDQIVIDDSAVDRKTLKLSPDNRKVWRFADSVMSDDGAVWQAYIRRAHKTSDAEIDSVIVLVWEKDNSQ